VKVRARRLSGTRTAEARARARHGARRAEQDRNRKRKVGRRKSAAVGPTRTHGVVSRPRWRSPRERAGVRPAAVGVVTPSVWSLARHVLPKFFPCESGKCVSRGGAGAAVPPKVPVRHHH